MAKKIHWDSLKRSIFSSALGNVIEWYDFGLFTIFSTLFGRLFFPNDSPQAGVLAAISIFAIGFVCRPLGALVFGYLGDKQGRARTLRLSILMISLPTLLIGCLPTYSEIGLFSPILLMLIRIWQGISIGGEYSGNLIYLAESAPTEHRAVFTSFASVGANLGFLLAALVGIVSTTFMSPTSLENGGWRLPYILSGILCLLIYRYRLRIQETDVFLYLKNHAQLVRNPIRLVFTKHWRELLRIIGLVCMGTTFYYFNFIYLPIFLTENKHLPIHLVSLLMTLFISLMILLVPLAGWCCDKIGRRKMYLWVSMIVGLIVIPGFYLLQLPYFYLTPLVLFFYTLGSSAEQGATSITVVENFPPPARYTGISLGYNMGNGFLGGTVPIICAWLMKNSSFSLMPAVYISICAYITFFVVLFFIPETKGIDLCLCKDEST